MGADSGLAASDRAAQAAGLEAKYPLPKPSGPVLFIAGGYSVRAAEILVE